MGVGNLRGYFFAAAACAVLAGCGGDGDNDSPPPVGGPPPPAPVPAPPPPAPSPAPAPAPTPPPPAPAPTPPPPPPAPPPAPLFTQIQDTIFTPICTSCHSGPGAPVGLRLDAANSYDLLVNVASGEVPTLLRVKPGDPNNSYLVQKIEGTATVGGRMPLVGAPLSQANINLVRQWISEGAVRPSSLTEQQLFSVTSTIPANGEHAVALDSVMVLFNRAVDVSLVNTGVFELLASGGDGSFTEGNELSIGIVQVDVPLGNPNVAKIRLAQPLQAESYQLVIRGTGPSVLADVSARAIDGDNDGESGGDHRLVFRVMAPPR